MGGPEMAPQTPQTLGAPRQSRGTLDPDRLLPRRGYSDATAEGADRARRAAWRQRRAHVLAKGDEQVVVADPESPRQPPPQRHLPLLRGARAGVAEPGAGPVHVRVHADAGVVGGHGY